MPSLSFHLALECLQEPCDPLCHPELRLWLINLVIGPWDRFRQQTRDARRAEPFPTLHVACHIHRLGHVFVVSRRQDKDGALELAPEGCECGI